jgi:membrane-bound serine protease (ClpP class)
MKILRWPVLLVIMLWCIGTLAAAIQSDSAAAIKSTDAPQQLPEKPLRSGPVYVIPLKGEVAPAQFYFLRRALKDAQRNGASAVILDIDTFGGRVDSAMEEMDALLATNIPTYAFVNPKAISAGSLISLATNYIYMHPSGIIGASAVVSGSGQELEKTMNEKATSMVESKAAGAASTKGHDPDIAKAFVRTEAKLIRDGEVLDSDTTLLTLNAKDAAKTYDNKPLLAVGIANDIDDLVRIAGLKGEVRHFEPSGFENIAFWITMFAPLLMIGGVVGAYIEMKAPGFGIPGLLSLVCFGLFFGGHLIAGLAGWEVITIFVLGVLLVISEVFIFPGMIIPGLIGVTLMVGCLAFAMVDHWPGSPTWPSSDELIRPMANLLIAFVGTGIVVSLLARILPKTTLYNRMVLQTAAPAGTAKMQSHLLSIGALGSAITDLRPAGKASFSESTYDVVAASGFISSGTLLRVIEVDGFRIVVEPAT